MSGSVITLITIGTFTCSSQPRAEQLINHFLKTRIFLIILNLSQPTVKATSTTSSVFYLLPIYVVWCGLSMAFHFVVDKVLLQCPTMTCDRNTSSPPITSHCPPQMFHSKLLGCLLPLKGPSHGELEKGCPPLSIYRFTGGLVKKKDFPQ